MRRERQLGLQSRRNLPIKDNKFFASQQYALELGQQNVEERVAEKLRQENTPGIKKQQVGNVFCKTHLPHTYKVVRQYKRKLGRSLFLQKYAAYSNMNDMTFLLNTYNFQINNLKMES